MSIKKENVSEQLYLTINRDSNARPDIFPDQWSCESICEEDVEFHSGSFNNLGVKKTKSCLNPSFWTNERIKLMVDSHSSAGDQWNFGSSCHVICVWLPEQKLEDQPIGFVAFSFHISRKFDENKKLTGDFSMTLALVWVRPEYRKKGVSKHIATHLISYLMACKPHVLIAGLDDNYLIYHADYYSDGGAQFSGYIESAVECFSDQGDEDPLWPGFNEMIIEAGF